MRALKALVIGMGVLIVAGTVTLVVLLVQRAGGVAPSAALPSAASLNQPPGTRLVGIAALDHRLAVALTGPGGDRVVLWDPRTGRIESTLRLGE